MAGVFGKDKVLYFRTLKDAKAKKGARLALQLEHTLTYERSTDSVNTKDGAIVTQTTPSASLSISAVSSRDELNQGLYDAFIAGEILEIWEVDLGASKEENKYDALYMQGKLESWELPASVDETVNISTTARIEGLPQKGEVTISEEDKKAIQYAFRDLEKVVEM